jgi:hypothetical protein
MKKSKTIIDRLQEEGITEIDAGYKKYKLIFSNAISHQGSACWGLTDFEKGTITLHKNMEHDLAKEILLHEMTHVILELGGLGGDEDAGMVPAHLNEHITVQVSRGLMLLMRLNSKVFELICEEGNENS